MTKSKAAQAEAAARREAARAAEDAPAQPDPVAIDPGPDANNGVIVAPPQPGVREAAPGEFFAPTTTDEEQARLDDLARQAAAAPLARSQWDS